MTAYSITPEGATAAAKEIADIVQASRLVESQVAAIILRHAEQSPEGQCPDEEVLIREYKLSYSGVNHGPEHIRFGAEQYADGYRSGWQASLRPAPPEPKLYITPRPSSEGEMREACIVCGCALMPPERTEPPHCMDCALTDEHYYAWEAGKGV